MKRWSRIAWLVAASARAGLAHAGGNPPPWLIEAAKTAVPAFGPRVGAVELLRERTVSVRDDGTTTAGQRGAIRVLASAGRNDAWCGATYEIGAGKVKSMR